MEEKEEQSIFRKTLRQHFKLTRDKLSTNLISVKLKCFYLFETPAWWAENNVTEHRAKMTAGFKCTQFRNRPTHSAR